MSNSFEMDLAPLEAACEPFLAAVGIRVMRAKRPVSIHPHYRMIGTVTVRPETPIRVFPRKGLTTEEEALVRGAGWDAFLNPPSTETGWKRHGDTWSCAITCDIAT